MARSPLPLGHPSTGRRHGGPFDTVLDSGGREKGKLTRPAPPPGGWKQEAAQSARDPQIPKHCDCRGTGGNSPRESRRMAPCPVTSVMKVRLLRVRGPSFPPGHGAPARRRAPSPAAFRVA